MHYVNGWTPGCKTKKALREAVKAGQQVYFYPTSEMGPQYRGYVGEIAETITLSVVGPDPYRDRRWYASVVRKNGKVVVS